jgi:hypothetical protein
VKPQIGRPRFRLERIQSTKLDFIATTECIRCGQLIDVSYGAIGATFRIGNEFIGVSCDACLSPESRQKLFAMRSTTDAPCGVIE